GYEFVLLGVKPFSLKVVRHELRIPGMTERETVIVNGNLIIPKPGDRLTNVFDRFADCSNDEVARLCEAKCRGHVSTHMRDRLHRRCSVLRVDVAIVNASDATRDII